MFAVRMASQVPPDPQVRSQVEVEDLRLSMLVEHLQMATGGNLADRFVGVSAIKRSDIRDWRKFVSC